jgi:rare lipoprotein A
MRLRFSIGFPLALLLVSSAALAEPPTPDPSAPQSLKAKTKPDAAESRKTVVAKRETRERATTALNERRRAETRARERQLAEAGPQPGRMKVVGAREVGTAAWYGGRYVGRRTSSGAVLDRIHATAAHRSLPLNSLARVTNLNNGRSVVVRVTDRGPVSHSLLIDVSPSAADQLDMRSAGLTRVAVEQVVELPPDAK